MSVNSVFLIDSFPIIEFVAYQNGQIVWKRSRGETNNKWVQVCSSSLFFLFFSSILWQEIANDDQSQHDVEVIWSIYIGGLSNILKF